jgi:hypothetical protein
MSYVRIVIFYFGIVLIFFGCQDQTKKTVHYDLSAVWKVHDQKRYESTTKIKFPSEFQVIAQGVQSEFVEISILQLNKKDKDDFLAINNFKPASGTNYSLFALKYLDTIHQKISEKDHLFYNYNMYVPKSDDIGWLYMYDTLTNKLYCQVQYPDPGGT